MKIRVCFPGLIVLLLAGCATIYSDYLEFHEIGKSGCVNKEGYRIEIGKSGTENTIEAEKLFKQRRKVREVYCNGEDAYAVSFIERRICRVYCYYSWSSNSAYRSVHFFVIPDVLPNNPNLEMRVEILLKDIKPKSILDKESQELKLEREAISEKERLTAETDKKYGVMDVIDGNYISENVRLPIGTVYRIRKPITTGKIDDDTYVCSSYDGHEYFVVGKKINIPTIRTSVLGPSRPSDYLPRYRQAIIFDSDIIVKYIGTEQVVTKGMLLKLVHVFEYITSNEYSRGL